MLAPFVEVIQKPYRALESIRITVEAHTEPSILFPKSFLGCSAPRLREIKLDGIALPFPVIRQVLLSTNNLVDLYLSNIPNDAYFSPSDLVTALSALVQLKQLTVGFHSPDSCLPPSMICPPPQRTTLPSLTSLIFHASSRYLEEFVAQIDLPACCEITIGPFNNIFFKIPQFSQFIPCLNAISPFTRTHVRHTANSVCVLFDQEIKKNQMSERCALRTSCRQFDLQMSFLAQITSQFSTFLTSVDSLTIDGLYGLPIREEDVDPTQWLEFFRPFTHVTRVYVTVNELVLGIMQALVAEDMTAEVLPELTSLFLGGFHYLRSTSPSVADAAAQFVAKRKLSGRDVTLSSM